MRRSYTTVTVIMMSVLAVCTIPGCGTSDSALSGAEPSQELAQTQIPAFEATVDPRTPGIASDAACDLGIESTRMAIPSLNDAVWASHHVVEANVTDVGIAERITTSQGVLPFVIARRVTLEVTSSFRGLPTKQLFIRLPGGRVGDCVQEYSDIPDLKPGMRGIFFLRVVGERDGYIESQLLGGGAGFWAITSAGTMAQHPSIPLDQTEIQSLTDLELQIAQELAAGPKSPDNYYLHTMLVPARDSPPSVNAEGTPTIP